MASSWKQQDRHRRNQHRLAEVALSDQLDERLLQGETRGALTQALARLPDRERQTLLAHEVNGQDTQSLGRKLGISAGAVAAQLHRTRARMRVEYLLAAENVEPLTPRCRPVLIALSSADRRRQRELDASGHLLECDLCAELSPPLLERQSAEAQPVIVPVRADSDIVVARQAVRELAARLGFPRTELTVIATAVSEVVRNIVRFAGEGKVSMDVLDDPRPGVRVVARDAGPGIADVEQALAAGFSTYNGLGLGLPGARRLMDEFSLVSQLGRGTTVTMIKWRRERRE